MSSAVQHLLRSWSFKTIYAAGKLATSFILARKRCNYVRQSPLFKLPVNKLVLVALFNKSLFNNHGKEASKQSFFYPMDFLTQINTYLQTVTR